MVENHDEQWNEIHKGFADPGPQKPAWKQHSQRWDMEKIAPFLLTAKPFLLTAKPSLPLVGKRAAGPSHSPRGEQRCSRRSCCGRTLDLPREGLRLGLDEHPVKGVRLKARGEQKTCRRALPTWRQRLGPGRRAQSSQRQGCRAELGPRQSWGKRKAGLSLLPPPSRSLQCRGSLTLRSLRTA